MGYSSYQNSDNVVPYYMAFVADMLTDVNKLPTNCAPGSTCIVIENSSLWMLGTDNQWHEM